MNKEQKEIKKVTDYIWKMINSKDLLKYKFGYHIKVIANIIHLTTIIKQQAKKEVFDDIENSSVEVPLFHSDCNCEWCEIKKKHLQPK